MSNRYLERGVSAIKEDVHNAIKNEKKGLFENAFCKVIPGYWIKIFTRKLLK